MSEEVCLNRERTDIHRWVEYRGTSLHKVNSIQDSGGNDDSFVVI